MLPEPQTRSVQLSDSCSGGVLSVRSLRANARVDGPIGETSIEVTFVNDLDRVVEGDLVLSMPPSAALSELTVVCGGRTIRGKIRPRERAKIEYRRAVDAGQTAAIGETEGEDLVRLRIAPIGKSEDVKVTFGVLFALTPTTDGHRLVIPLTYMPRFVESGSKLKETEQAAVDRPRPPTLAARADVKIEVVHAKNAPVVRCASHAMSIEVGAKSSSLLIAQTPLDRDLLVDIIDRAEATSVWARHDPSDGPDGNGPTTAVAVIPPAFADEGATTPRTVTFLVDRSGSMGGAPMESAIRAVRGALRGLEAQDRFNIIAFDTSLDALSSSAVPFTQASLKAADTFIQSITARGGTSASMAIQAALEPASMLGNAVTVLPPVAADTTHRLHLVVFMTDGDVAGAEQVLLTAREKMIDTRVHVLGIGDAVNHAMLGAIARAGGGTYTPVSTTEDLERALVSLKNAMSAPLWTSVKVAIDVDGELRAPKLIQPAAKLDLFAGRPMLLAWRGELAAGSKLVLTGQRQDGDDLRIVTPLDAAKQDDRDASKRLASRVWGLLRNLEVTYRFNAEDDPTLEAIGTAFGIANRAVALVGVHDEVRSDKAEETVPVVLPMPRNLASADEGSRTRAGTITPAQMAQFQSMAANRSMSTGAPPAPAKMSAPARPMAPAAPMPAGAPPPAPRPVVYGAIAPGAGLPGGPPPAPPPPAAPAYAAPAAPPPMPRSPAPVAAAPQSAVYGNALMGDLPELEEASVAPKLSDDEAGLRAIMLLQDVDGRFEGSVEVTFVAIASAVIHGHTAREGAFRSELRRTVGWLRANLATLTEPEKTLAALALSLLTVPHGEPAQPSLAADLAARIGTLSLSDLAAVRATVVALVDHVLIGARAARVDEIRKVFLHR